MRIDVRRAPELFSSFCAAVVRHLPFGLDTVVAPSLVGFALINGFTFGVDLTLLTVARSVFGLPLPVSVTVAYVCAFALSFVLNRSMNFRSHAPMGRQAVLYAIAIGVNYVVFILGVGAGLAVTGVEYHLARILAGACEGVFLYCVMRWIVFSRARLQGPRPERVSRGRPR
ncbi:GtrA family protein [Amycolatopsis pigmentata]|uniref:GtrA family protein n=1 Tax=Amycolatopsis pigmentata TaxID=450801 RepID=A0ABW5G5L9_9PSEU